MRRLPLLFPVDPAAAALWLQGQVPPGTLWPGDGADLLEWHVDQSPCVYLARLNGRAEWPALQIALEILNPSVVLCRTRCPGLVRLFERSGGGVTFREADGAARCYAGPEAVARFRKRLRNLNALQWAEKTRQAARRRVLIEGPWSDGGGQPQCFRGLFPGRISQNSRAASGVTSSR